MCEQILSDDSIDKPYYISCCGKIFVSTQRRLSELSYFNGIINGGFVKTFSGTQEDPYKCDIPPKQFKNILRNLRDKRVKLCSKSIKILKNLAQIPDDTIKIKTNEEPFDNSLPTS